MDSGSDRSNYRDCIAGDIIELYGPYPRRLYTNNILIACLITVSARQYTETMKKSYFAYFVFLVLGFVAMAAAIYFYLDYYTNVVFEIDVPALGKQKQVCGGGRYNQLIEEFGGEITPATGFSFGVERLILVLEMQEKLKAKASRSDIFIATKPDTQDFGMEVAQKLRAEGIRVESDLMQRIWLRPTPEPEPCAFLSFSPCRSPFLFWTSPKKSAQDIKSRIFPYLCDDRYHNLIHFAPMPRYRGGNSPTV